MSRGRTLLICCEEGEISYTEEYLQEKDMVLEQVTEMETLTPAYFKEFDEKIPSGAGGDRVQRHVEAFRSFKHPVSAKLGTAGAFTLRSNGLTLDMYLKNMRNMLMEQLTESELIVINRCAPGVDRSGVPSGSKGTKSHGAS